MRHILFFVSALAAVPAFAQYSNYGYDVPAQQAYQQQQYFAQQQGYSQPQQTYYQQPVPQQQPPQQTYYQQPYQQAQYQQAAYDQGMAQSQINPAVGLVNTDYLNIGLGATQVVDTDQNILLNVEYRYLDIYYGLRPIVGFHMDSESALYGYAGFNWDIQLTDSWWFTPTASVGAYSQGDGQDLGHGIEFRTGIELAYQRENNSRIGLQLTHLSNAGIGDRNPGTEILQLNYAWPLGWQQ